MIKNIFKALPLKIAASIGIAFLSIFGLGACGTDDATPHDLTGTYVFKDGDLAMVGEVTGGTIQINMQGRGVYSLYWAGDFAKTAKTGDKVNSAANVEQLKGSMTGSMDKTKEFAIDGDSISFKMTMMGVTKDIQMEKNSSSVN